MRIKGTGDRLLVLAPLERTDALSPRTLGCFDLEKLEQENKVRVRDYQETNFDGLSQFVVGLLVFGGIAAGVVHDTAPGVFRWVMIGGVALFAVVIAFALFAVIKGFETVLRAMAQSLSLLLILLIAVGIPAGAIYYFGGGRYYMAGTAMPLELFACAVQFIFICIASLLPALLYYVFDRQQSGTLRRRIEQQIFRLDWNVHDLVDLNAKYGKQMDEVFGVETSNGGGRILRGTRWPIPVATLIITLGWLITLLPVTTYPQAPMAASDLMKVLIPQQSAWVFGFLGAYLFSLSTILRRYVRGDLKPKAYSGIAVRFFVVSIITWCLGTTDLWQGAVLVMCFFAGIFPDFAITMLREKVFSRMGGAAAPSLEDPQPLTELEGMDVYDRARLADEGVTNIEALAHHELVDLIIETRFPAHRIIDWLDQAILYLHISGDQPQSGGTGLRQALRSCGIRTATDLECCWQEAKKRNEEKAFLAKLGQEQMDDKPLRLQVILDAMQDDEWLQSVRNWRDEQPVQEEAVDAIPSKITPLPQPGPAPAPSVAAGT